MNERIFYMDQDSDLSELTSTLKDTKADTVLFVLPKNSLLFESVVNLQILRSAAEEHKKEVVIITHYVKGQELCAAAGVESHPTIEHWEKKLPSDIIIAKKNIEQDFGRKSSIRHISLVIDSDEEEEPAVIEPAPNWRELLARPSWQALGGLVIFSFGLFFFLSFLAFPGATVEIRPEKKAVEVITNIQIMNAEKVENPDSFPKGNQILGFPVESIFEKEMDFSTISKEFQGTNAGGEITIYNKFPEERRLRPTTRFQIETGLVYRIPDWVIVPPATKDQDGKLLPGSRTVEVSADEKDIFGEFVGDRGNISPKKFFLPGLPESSRESLWAESTKPFTGGTTAWQPRVKQADIDAAQRKIEAELLASAEEDLQKFLDAKNAREKKDLTLLVGDKFVEKTVIDIAIEDNILNTTKESFHISAKLKVRTWAYSHAELHTLLWDELQAKTNQRMRLVGIDINENTFDLLERNEQEGYLKISVSARGAQEFLIDPRSEAGILFVNDMKRQTVGLPLDEAEAIVANQEEVSEVQITVWPFWRSKMPALPENISVKMVSDGEVKN